MRSDLESIPWFGSKCLKQLFLEINIHPLCNPINNILYRSYIKSGGVEKSDFFHWGYIGSIKTLATIPKVSLPPPSAEISRIAGQQIDRGISGCAPKK